jgi:hypothetical protein
MAKQKTTKKQLVERLLLYIKLNGVYYGLCGVVVLMTAERKFKKEEKDELLDIIELNRPVISQKIFQLNRGFYFPQGQSLPRIKFLEEILTKL